jgi:FixJ family two-component response regulator
MERSKATIFVVDDEESVRKAFNRLLTANDFNVKTFESGERFLQEHDATLPGCLLLDLSLPDVNGLQVQDALSTAGIDRPIIFVTGRADVPSSVRALKGGAVDFISKPIEEADLLRAIQTALALDHEVRQRRTAVEQVKQRMSRLTPREYQVFVRVVEGRLNKQIAGELGTQERTVKVHRARVMRKMGARTLADLIHLAARVQIGERTSAAVEFAKKAGARDQVQGMSIAC